jgi:hypothetical protein
MSGERVTVVEFRNAGSFDGMLLNDVSPAQLREDQSKLEPVDSSMPIRQALLTITSSPRAT